MSTEKKSALAMTETINLRLGQWKGCSLGVSPSERNPINSIPCRCDR